MKRAWQKYRRARRYIKIVQKVTYRNFKLKLERDVAPTQQRLKALAELQSTARAPKVGASVGAAVGFAVGLAVGALGEAVAFAVAFTVGTAVGLAVGAGVGAVVGAGVGAAVGAK